MITNGGSKFHRETLQCPGNDRGCIFDLQSLAKESVITASILGLYHAPLTHCPRPVQALQLSERDD